MRTGLKFLAYVFLVFSFPSAGYADDLKDYWAGVSKTIATGDFHGYAATYHPDAIYVDGTKNISYPISAALARWKQGFDDTAAGKMTARVDFRFGTTRVGDTTAHQTGMFNYAFENKNGESGEYFVHFEALLVKKDGWKMMMEYQVKSGTAEEWAALKN